MQIPLGVNELTGQAVILDTKAAINPHVQVTGITGMGKSHLFRNMSKALVESAAAMKAPLRIHVLDPHGDLEMPYSSEVMFSSATNFGYNPLEINPDPDYGGVRRTIQKFIAALDKTRKLGSKQEAAMRYLLEDLYISHGYKLDDPRTWSPDDPFTIRSVMMGREGRIYLDVAFEHRERFKLLLKDQGSGRVRGGFDDFKEHPSMSSRKSWWIEQEHYEGEFLMWEPRNIFKTAPTLDDAIRFVERKLKAQFMGTNSAAMALLKDVNTLARGFQRKISELSKRGAALSEAEKSDMTLEIDKARAKASDAYSSYLKAITTGRELDDLIRYNSTEVLTSVYERLQNARATGIYNPVPPPFNPQSPIWRYIIRPLDIPVQRAFVDMVCSRIFDRAMQRGLKDDLVEVIILDEGKRYLTDDDDSILNKIANEARKFGLGLWMASQTPAHFNDDFLKSTGTIIVLGLSSADTSLAARKLGLDEARLTKVVPHKSVLVQVKNKGQLSAEFQSLKPI